MNRYLLLFSFALFFICCNQEKPANQNDPAAAAENATQPAAAPALPSIPLETVQKLWNECNHVDYIFYELPMSMSLDEKSSIQYAIRHISDSPAALRTDCKPTGRVSYQINGNIELEADFYYSQGCTYFIFYKNQQKTYANLMTEEGVKYFGDQVKQGIELRKKMQ